MGRRTPADTDSKRDLSRSEDHIHKRKAKSRVVRRTGKDNNQARYKIQRRLKVLHTQLSGLTKSRLLGRRMHASCFMLSHGSQWQ
jgi:hypothetical protein